MYKLLKRFKKWKEISLYLNFIIYRIFTTLIKVSKGFWIKKISWFYDLWYIYSVFLSLNLHDLYDRDFCRIWFFRYICIIKKYFHISLKDSRLSYPFFLSKLIVMFVSCPVLQFIVMRRNTKKEHKYGH